MTAPGKALALRSVAVAPRPSRSLAVPPTYRQVQLSDARDGWAIYLTIASGLLVGTGVRTWGLYGLAGALLAMALVVEAGRWVRRYRARKARGG